MRNRIVQRGQWLWGRSSSSGTFTRNVTVTLFVQLFSLALSVANAAIIARVLGPQGKGTVALLLLVPNVFGLFLSSGLGVANVYFAGSQRIPVAVLTANSTTYALLASAVGAVFAAALYATGLLAKMLPGVPMELLAISMLSLPFILAGGFYSAILQGLQQIASVNLVNLSQRLVILLLTAGLLVGLHIGLPGAVFASITSEVVVVLLLARLLRRRGAMFRPRLDKAVLRTTLPFGMRGYIGNVLQFFNYRLDFFLVNYFLGAAGTGIYTVSVAMAEMLWYLPNAVGFVIFPKAANTPRDAMNRFTPRVFRATLALTLVGAIGLALVGQPFIRIVYSQQFASAYLPMLALLPGVVLLGGAKVLTNEIAGRGHPQYNSIASGAALVLTVIFDLLLIPRLGVLGASLASSIAYIAIFFLAVAFYASVSRRSAGAGSRAANR